MEDHSLLIYGIAFPLSSLTDTCSLWKLGYWGRESEHEEIAGWMQCILTRWLQKTNWSSQMGRNCCLTCRSFWMFIWNFQEMAPFVVYLTGRNTRTPLQTFSEAEEASFVQNMKLSCASVKVLKLSKWCPQDWGVSSAHSSQSHNCFNWWWNPEDNSQTGKQLQSDASHRGEAFIYLFFALRLHSGLQLLSVPLQGVWSIHSAIWLLHQHWYLGRCTEATFCRHFTSWQQMLPIFGKTGKFQWERKEHLSFIAHNSSRISCRCTCRLGHF